MSDCVTHHEACDCREAAHAAEVDRLTADLAACYRLSGADPDGNSDAHLARYAVAEVGRLRQEADEADARVATLEGDVRTWIASAELHGKRAAKADARVATLEGAMRDHDDCRVCLGLLDD